MKAVVKCKKTGAQQSFNDKNMMLAYAGFTNETHQKQG